MTHTPFTYDYPTIWTIAAILGALATLVVVVWVSSLILERFPRTENLAWRLSDLAPIALIVFVVLAIAGAIAAVALETSNYNAAFAAWAKAEYGYTLSGDQVSQLYNTDRSSTILSDGTILDASHSVDGIYLIERSK